MWLEGMHGCALTANRWERCDRTPRPTIGVTMRWLCLVLTTLAACGNSGTPADATGTAADDTQVAPGDAQTTTGDALSTDSGALDTTGVTCDRLGFTVGGPVEVRVEVEGTTRVALFYDAFAEPDTIPVDVLQLELLYNRGASDAPHTFVFADQNYSDCHTCAVLKTHCITLSDCDQIFLAVSGSVVITENGGSDGRVRGSLSA
ncbi:MAG: hypothetical protein ACI9MR_004579, partial [Myxococcota bacterium]